MPEYSPQRRSPYSSGFYIQDLGTAGFFGLEFVDTFEDRIIPNQNLVSTPSVLIEGSTILLDYSDIDNDIDRNFVDTLFNSMSASGGTFSSGFTISGAVYNDPIRNYSADLAASCTLNSYSMFKILGTFSSIGSTTETNFYKSEFFETVPQISSSTGLTSGITMTAVVNYPTSTSTSFVGNQFQVGDYLDFNTSLNSGRYIVQGITLDSLDREILFFSVASTSLAVAEDLKGTEVVVGHSRKTDINTSGPVNINLENAVVHRIGKKLTNGINYITLDSVIEKELVLNRGMQYVFVIDDIATVDFQFLNSDQASTYSDAGVYSITDNTTSKKYVFFTPNNLTPNQLYYSSANTGVIGVGGIKVVGSYDYQYDATFGGGTTGGAARLATGIVTTSSYG
tara:strand:- start:2566 stop:3753 length:1188 start_codon:yes stop_codon:yes gene_type:complete